MEINPENIAKRHEKHPDATPDLIDYYANMKVVEHINKLLKYSSIVEIPTNDTVIIVSDRENWKKFEGFDLFAGLPIKTLEKFTKE